MSDAAMSPLEVVLRYVAAAAPQPWYPRLHAEKMGVTLDSLNYFLEHLWLDGLLQKGGSSPETGGSVLLSPFGEQVLRDPELLRRLRVGEPLKPNDRGGIVRAVFRQQQKPVITRLLLWANVLWFGVGLYLAQTRHNAASAYLSTFSDGGEAVTLVRHQTGSVSPDDLIHGEWWRLLSCCFVHIGFIHLAFNMYALYMIGRGAEQLWGRWRYLAIYLLSGFSGSCVALAYKPTILAGASGALCGILGAELVWLLLNGRLLPRRVVRRWWWGMGLNILLLGWFSSMANVSALAHFGGMGVGAVAALLLNVQRFGPAGWRWLTLLPLAALPWLGVDLMQRQRVVNPDWQDAEARLYNHDYRKRIFEAQSAAADALSADQRRTAEQQLALVVRARERCAALSAELSGTGSYRSPAVLKWREKLREEMATWLTALEKREQQLRQFVDDEAADSKEEAAFVKQFWQRVVDTTTTAEKLRATDWKPDEKQQALQALAAQRMALGRLAAELQAAGAYHSEAAENARRVGLDYLRALDRLLDLTENRLRASEAWTADKAAELRKQEVTVEQWRSKWLDLGEKK